MTGKWCNRLYWTVVVKSVLSPEATFSIYQLGHELLVVIKRMRSWIQEAEMSIHCRLAGLNMRDKVRSLDIWREFRVVPLLLERETAPGKLPLEVFYAPRSHGSPKTPQRDHIAHLAWEHLRIPQEVLESSWGEEYLEYPAWLAPTVSRPEISGRKWMDEWRKDIMFLNYCNYSQSIIFELV